VQAHLVRDGGRGQGDGEIVRVGHGTRFFHARSPQPNLGTRWPARGRHAAGRAPAAAVVGGAAPGPGTGRLGVMELDAVSRRRRMVRRSTSEPVGRAAVERMLATAVRPPSAGFSQGWAFLVRDTPGDVARFWTATTPPQRAAEPDRWLGGMRT